MKFLRILLAMAFPSVSNAERVPAAAPATAGQWGVFEITLKGPAGGNPFIEISLEATFTDGTRSASATGFYDGDGTYRVRFMPGTTGKWTYLTRSSHPDLTGHSGGFPVTPREPGNHGPVGAANTWHFAHADGTPFRPVGTTSYGWAQRPQALQKQTLRTLAEAPFNKLRMLLLPQDIKDGQPPPERFPYEGTPPKQWDTTRFNPAFFQHLERRIGQLGDLGIECDLVLFHPYGRQWGFSEMDPASDERYLRYVVARLAAYRNIWWSMANEYDYLRWKQPACWDRHLRLVQEIDPHNHLRSIHNGTVIYNHTQPWVTHASIQSGAAVEEPGRAELLRSAYQKPVVYDEVKYEGDVESRWGQLSGREMVHRIWCGTVVGTYVGTYVGHGECLRDPGGVIWLPQGGVLRGESPPRIAFLRKILEDGPAEGIEPIDKWQEPAGFGGQPARYYLLYFGRETPESWPFQLYRNGLTDGMRFQVEVIDTWDMTITPVEGEFVTKRKDRYQFIDAADRAVTLPGKPGMALRIKRIGPIDGDPVLMTPDE